MTVLILLAVTAPVRDAATVIFRAVRAAPEAQPATGQAYVMPQGEAFRGVLVPQKWVYALPGLSNLWPMLNAAAHSAEIFYGALQSIPRVELKAADTHGISNRLRSIRSMPRRWCSFPAFLPRGNRVMPCTMTTISKTRPQPLRNLSDHSPLFHRVAALSDRVVRNH